MVGRQLPFFSLIVPAWLIWAFAGWRGMVQVWPAILVTGAILIGLGFSPLAASGLSLIANTAPVAYGALGTPIAGLASVIRFYSAPWSDGNCPSSHSSFHSG